MSERRNFDSPSGNPDGEEESLKVVEIIQVSTLNDKPQVLVRCELVRGVVQMSGDETVIKELGKERFYWGAEEVTPKDGEKFLLALRVKYDNPYFYARKVN